MSEPAKIMCGVILITLPTIQYGGYFLLQILSGKHDKMALTPFQKAMFRAGHAHAGVLVILSLLVQLLADYASLSEIILWLVRAGFPFSAILISGGFFGAAAGKNETKPNELIWILYAGIFLLMVVSVVLGIGLLT